MISEKLGTTRLAQLKALLEILAIAIDAGPGARDLSQLAKHAGQEPTVRTGHGTTGWFQIGKGVLQGCILSPCIFNLYAECIMRNAGLEEA